MTDALPPLPVEIPRSAGWLGYLGLLPFLIQMLVAVLAPHGEHDVAGLAAYGVMTYGAIILSFLGGITWGLTVNNTLISGPDGKRELVYSVLPALGAWLALALPVKLGLSVVAIGFACAFVHDYRHAKLQRLPAWFMRLRLHLSLGAVSCVVLTALYS